MLKVSQLTTEKDRREADKISRRRLQERQRKERILDTKSRIFGLDTEALDQQVAAKQRQKDAEKRRDQEFAELERKTAEELGLLERQELEMKRQLEDETNLFRKTSQLKESSREFDLNDKDALKKEVAPRVPDHDPWLSVSGAQKFAGEDLAHSERLKAQKEEQRFWLQRQMEEKQRERAARKLQDRDICSALLATATREDQRVAMDTARRNELSRENAEFNQRLARQRQTQRISDRVTEEQDNLAEIYNHLSSDILTENPETATSALGGNRKVQTMYRGMSKAEVETYRQAQLRQQEESLRRVGAEKRREEELQRVERGIHRQGELEQRQQERLARNEMMDLKEENQRLAGEQMEEQRAIKEQAMGNEPTEEYFKQFNTTSR